jgi:RNA polymerase sigma-70 factor (ECF subfamily)
MASLSRTLDSERLLAQAGWVRALARRLVLDEALAEDVVQDTWVAALERPPGADGRGGLRAWLAAVARNLALRRRRRELARAAVERAAARRESIGGGEEELERMQLQRALVDAVLALEEPYRSAVVLRHLDGLSAAEIARRQGCSSAAARQRVSRGLAELRERLAREHGPVWRGCLALAPLLGRGWSGLAGSGGIVMGGKLTLGVAGAALALLAVWLVIADGAGRAEPGRAGDAGRTALVPRSPPAEEGLEPPQGSLVQGSGIAAQAAPGARVPHARPYDGPEPAAFPLRGRVTDTLGRPLAEAVLRIVRGSSPIELVSGPDGIVAGELPAELRGERTLEALREGYVSRSLELDLALPFTLALEALPAIAGRLLDPRSSPVAPPGYVKVEVLDARTNESKRSEVELAEDGTFRLEWLPLGRLVGVEARARGFAATEVALDRGLEPDRTVELDLVLARGAVVTGTVLDGRSREPVPGATVWMDTFEPEEDSVHPVTRADERGRFRLEGANEDPRFQDGARVVFFQLVAEAEGYVATPTRAYGALANDEHAYDFELLLEPAGCSLRIEARLADGRPAGGATVWAIDAQGNAFFESADGGGIHEFRDLPAGPFGLWLAFEEKRQVPVVGAPSGIASVEVTSGTHALRVDLELARLEARSLVLVLQPPGSASLAGRVVDVHGRGVAGFTVCSQLNFQLGNLMLASGWDETETGADGAYRFDGLHAGKYQVWAKVEGTSLACAQPRHTYVDVDQDRKTEVPLLRVGACLTIEGRVEPLEHDLAALELAALDPTSGARLATTRPTADGSFRFEPLVEQEYEVVLSRGDAVLDRASAGPASSSGLFLRAR